MEYNGYQKRSRLIKGLACICKWIMMLHDLRPESISELQYIFSDRLQLSITQNSNLKTN